MKVFAILAALGLLTAFPSFGAAPATTVGKPVKKKSVAAKTKTRLVKKAPAKKAIARTLAKPPARTAVSYTKRNRYGKRYIQTAIYRRPAVSPQLRAAANMAVSAGVGESAPPAIENAAALVPFFEQLYRHQRGEMEGPLSILHYGDSHTAADEWTGDLRMRFQNRFGDGGGGYSYPGRPWTSFRRLDVRSGSTKGWHSDGLVGRTGDGLYGLGGVSMTATTPRESVYLSADCEKLEIYFLRQPGGGSMQLVDNGGLVERIPTEGPLGPGYYRYSAAPGPHRFDLETLDHAPVRLFGWVTQNARGITYEPLGINGAQASIIMNWDENILAHNVAHRNPGLIVLAYGTNEAGNGDWTLETYRDMFSALIQRFRRAAPAATILVVGPPDRFIKTRFGWTPMDKIDMIVAAQREAAVASNCAFMDLRAKMGGKGSMQQWVLAGLAQGDYVHFTAPGYRMLGDSMFRDIMGQYSVFLKVREQWTAEAAAASAPNN